MALALGAACSNAPSKGDGGADAGKGCAKTADCPAGEVCAIPDAGGPLACIGCRTNGECGPTQLCDAQRQCAFRPGWGDQCALNADCGAGQLCDQGLCVAAGQATLCQRNNCAAGQRCNLQNQVCEQDLGCTSDGQCLAAQVCNLGTLSCVPRCDLADAGAVCTPGQSCVQSRCVDCTADGGCGPGLACDLVSGTCTAPGLCFTDASCPAGTVCNPATNTCVTAIVPCTSNDGCARGQICDAVRGKCLSAVCQPDQFSPNQTAAQAAPIAVGTTYTNLTLCGPTDQDWYAVALLSGDRIQVTISTDVTGCGYSFDAQLRDDAGTILADGPNLSLAGVAPATASYYLRMTDGDPSCLYSFSTLVSHGQPCPPNPLGDLTSQAKAAVLDGGSVGPLYLCAGQTDWFAVTGAGAGFTATLGCDPSQGPLGLAALWPDGGAIAQSNDGNPLQTVTVPPLGLDPIYLTVSGAGQTNAFTLALGPGPKPAADAGVDGGTDGGSLGTP